MYPVVFEIFGFPISSFGLAMAIAFLAGTWVAGIQLEERKLSPDLAGNLMIWAMVGGILGAKLYYSVDFYFIEGIPFWQSMLSRAGMTFYGGAILGVIFVIIGTWHAKAPLWEVSQCGAVTLALGQAIGRIGCFLVGDDYGKASDLPWAMAFPQGLPPIDIPVHPTQLYEAFWLFGVSAFLWRRRGKSPFLFGEFMILNGVGRFAVETLRLNARVALGMSEAQWIGIALVIGGVIGCVYFHKRASHEHALS
jgi:phosphatidylglycerol:prolipoprotein diacylglycerol transferase